MKQACYQIFTYQPIIEEKLTFNAKFSHSFGAPLAKVLLTSDHQLDCAEWTKHQHPIACALLHSFHEDTDQKHQMLILVAVVPKCKTNRHELQHLMRALAAGNGVGNIDKHDNHVNQ